MGIFDRKKNIPKEEPYRDRVFYKQHPTYLWDRVFEITRYLDSLRADDGLQKYDLPNNISYTRDEHEYCFEEEGIKICTQAKYGKTFDDIKYYNCAKIMSISDIGFITCAIAPYKKYYGDQSPNCFKHLESLINYDIDSVWIGKVCGVIYHQIKSLKIINQYSIKARPYWHEVEYIDKIKEIYQEGVNKAVSYLAEVAAPELKALKMYEQYTNIVDYVNNYAHTNEQLALPGS